MCAAAFDALPNRKPDRSDLADTAHVHDAASAQDVTGAHNAGCAHETQCTPHAPVMSNPSETRSPLARRIIRSYQEYLSGLKMGPTCRFEPTCSNYALTAFGRYGPIKGFLLSAARLARCGPWHPGGWDPVPPTRSQRRRLSRENMTQRNRTTVGIRRRDQH